MVKALTRQLALNFRIRLLFLGWVCFGIMKTYASASENGNGRQAGRDVYRRPVPQLPLILDPSQILDVFSQSLSVQIHATAFSLDERHNPIPHVVEDFSVSSDRLTYDFRLREMNFPDGPALRADHFKASFENAIRQRAYAYDRFRFVEGFEDFLNGEQLELVGVRVEGERHVSIHLTRPDPRLIWKLSDPRYAIWQVETQNLAHGLGPYRIGGISEERVLLERNPGFDSGPSVMEFVLADRAEAIRGFDAKLYDDLFFYPLGSQEIESYQGRANIERSFMVRSYVILLNPRTLHHVEEREYLVERLKTDQLVNECFPDEQPVNQIVPRAFLGHNHPTPTQSIKRRPGLQRPLRILIVDGVGHEACLRDYIQQALQDEIPVEVSIRSNQAFHEAWLADQVDMVLPYVEVSVESLYFGLFNPDAAFPILPKRVVQYARLLEEFETSYSRVDQQQAASKICETVFGQRVYVPLFHSELRLVYQPWYQSIRLPTQSLAFIPLTRMSLK
ncbi:MAG: hypothetical protein EA369_04215 [Bradymonadales bacterium]|nr:MAG: hypothetical protein EA369_04215 [Bradymonadales bacterium]